MLNGRHNVVRHIAVVAVHTALALVLAGCEGQRHLVSVTYTCLDFNGITGVCARWHQRAEIVMEQSGNDEDEGGGCFPADAIVLGRNGPMRISDLGLGDEVLGYDAAEGKPVYTEVRTWLHRHPTADTPMLELTTEAGNSFIASPGHMIALENEQKGSRFVRARDLSPGDALITGGGRSDAVVSVKEVQGRGLYAPLTHTSNLFIGGAELLSGNMTEPDAHHRTVLAHSFAHVSEPQRYEWAWHLLLSAVEHIKPSWGQASSLNDVDGYVHPVARLLMRLLGIAPIENIAIESEVDGVTGRRLAGGSSSSNNDQAEKRKELLITIIGGVLGFPPFLSMQAVRPSPPVEDIHLEMGEAAPSATDDGGGLPGWAVALIVCAGLFSLGAFVQFMRRRQANAQRSFSGILGAPAAEANNQGEVLGVSNGPADPGTRY
mmetsp:Transcript_18085/g.32800  ORF Transcript_18085/g.32800 Transcript_18085/m.32800 type:complete len:433 (+) Transcript_18085:63-1361(+)